MTLKLINIRNVFYNFTEIKKFHIKKLSENFLL